MITVHQLEIILIVGGLLAAACCVMCYVLGRGDRRRLKALKYAWRGELRGEIEANVRAAYDADLIKARSERTAAEMKAERLRAEAADSAGMAELLGEETRRLGRRLAAVGRLADDYDRCVHVLQGPGVAARIRRTLQAAVPEVTP